MMRALRRLVDVVDRAPVGGDLGRAVHVARLADALVLGGDLARVPAEVVEPGLDVLAGDLRALGVLVDDRLDAVGGRLGDAGRALGHEQQHAVVLGGEVREVEAGVARVVDPRHRRLVAVDHDLAQHREAGRHVLERPAEERVVLGEVREQLDGHLADEAERALVADHDVTDVGAGGAARHVLDARDLAAGEHGLEADDHVLDAAVQRRELADAARGDEAAHVGHRLGLRRVAGGEPVLAHAVLERLQRHAALAGGLHVVGVDARRSRSSSTRR